MALELSTAFFPCRNTVEIFLEWYISRFKSNFVVETRGAGAGQLTVRVRGPKGAFNVEMQREKKNERTIHCKYEPKEPGDYQVGF